MDNFFSNLNVYDLFKLKEIAEILVSPELYEGKTSFSKFFFDEDSFKCIGKKDLYWVYYERGIL